MKNNQIDIQESDVCVVYPSPEKDKNARLGYSVEALSLATIIQSANKHLKYYDFSLSNYDNILEHKDFYAGNQNQKKVVFLFVDSVPLHRSSNVEHAIRISKSFKDISPHSVVIACGPWCMLTQESFPYADITFYNEPEYDFRQLCKGVIPVPSLSKTPRLLHDLTQLPIPSYNLLPGKEYHDVQNALDYSAVIQTTRGCRNGCTFCPRQSWNLRQVRHRPLKSVLDEIVILKEKGIQNIWIDDDNMGADSSWSIALFSSIAEINKEHQLKFFISCEVNVPKSFFIMAKNAGVQIVSFGIESGSEKVLTRIRKPSNIQLISSAVHNANHAGLFTVGNFILGLPGETLDDLELTKELMLNLPLDEVNIKILSYVRGAPLWDMAIVQNALLASSPCFFASKETGTSAFKFEELVQKQLAFKEMFQKNPARITRLRAKMQVLGYPYAVHGNSEK